MLTATPTHCLHGYSQRERVRSAWAWQGLCLSSGVWLARPALKYLWSPIWSPLTFAHTFGALGGEPGCLELVETVAEPAVDCGAFRESLS